MQSKQHISQFAGGVGSTINSVREAPAKIYESVDTETYSYLTLPGALLSGKPPQIASIQSRLMF